MLFPPALVFSYLTLGCRKADTLILRGFDEESESFKLEKIFKTVKFKRQPDLLSPITKLCPLVPQMCHGYTGFHPLQLEVLFTYMDTFPDRKVNNSCQHRAS